MFSPSIAEPVTFEAHAEPLPIPAPPPEALEPAEPLASILPPAIVK